MWFIRWVKSSIVSYWAPEFKGWLVAHARCSLRANALCLMPVPHFEIMYWRLLSRGEIFFKLDASAWNSGICLRSCMMLLREHIFLSNPPFFKRSTGISAVSMVAFWEWDWNGVTATLNENWCASRTNNGVRWMSVRGACATAWTRLMRDGPGDQETG